MNKRLGSYEPQLHEMFFQGNRVRLKGFTDKQLGLALHNFFSIFDMQVSQYDFQLHIEKTKSHQLSLMVVVKNKAIVPLQSSTKQKAEG